MAVYHQMGHHSENLLDCEECAEYAGAILSPVNYVEDQVVDQIESYADNEFKLLFDCQLYYPQSERGHLAQWTYFPSDVDTADLSSDTWWSAIVERVAEVARRLRPSAVLSPAVVPASFDDDYYARCCSVATDLAAAMQGSAVDTIPTVLARLDDLAAINRSAEIASILTGVPLRRAYVVLISATEPRREIRETESLKGAMRLIRFLEEAGTAVIVGFCSSDVILWKSAGATDCATGKFFNLRRFTQSRFAPPPEGGGQVPYWFEESLMAFLRESDLVRVRHIDLLSQSSLSNPGGQLILEKLDVGGGTPWLADSWRQFLWWFADFEARSDQENVEYDGILQLAEQNWQVLSDSNVLMEEPANEGGWLRPWRRAVLEAFAC